MKKLAFFVFSILFVLAACEKTSDLKQSTDGFYSGSNGIGNGSNPTVDSGGDQYNEYLENQFILADTQAVSTFSVDADGGSYANIKRYIYDENQKPPVGAIRIEELINYFPMDYSEPGASAPIALNGEVADCPWSVGHKLIRIGIKGRSIPAGQEPTANWVLLVDVSGSMGSPDKLDLVKAGMLLFVDQSMRLGDRLAIVTYAGNAGVALQSTPGTEKAKIRAAIESLGSGGSTAGAAGIITAYEIAQANLVQGGNNRILLATDGDFNVGPSSQAELVQLIEEKRDLGIFLTVIGVGRGNYNEATMEQIADHGNGTYEYMGDIEQAEKVLVHETGKFFTVAKDVKVQVQFNPMTVKRYRLIGYENRVLENEDFLDDQKDAGEIGAGQTITALYEIEPVLIGASSNLPLFNIDFRYKDADANESQPLSLEILDEQTAFGAASENLRFAASVAGFGMLLRDSQYKGTATYDAVLDWATASGTFDPHGYRNSFLEVVKKAKEL